MNSATQSLRPQLERVRRAWRGSPPIFRLTPTPTLAVSPLGKSHP